MDLLQVAILQIPVYLWIAALGIFFFVFLTTVLVRKIFLIRYQRLSALRAQDVNALIAGEIGRMKIFFIFILSIFLGSLVLPLQEGPREFINLVMVIALMIQIGIWGMGIINFLIDRKAKATVEEDPGTFTTLVTLKKAAQFILWTIIILVIFENLPGIEVTSLLAGLGIGGVAVALAVQNILGDLFSSLTIVLDKPFVLGDSITVDQYSGTVEKIGLKSTRIRSFQGEQLIFSNSDLLSSRIQNFKRMNRRRTIIHLIVSADTPYEKLKRIPEMVAEEIDGLDQVTFDRAHMFDIGGTGIDYEIVYYLETQDYTVYMDRRQAINFALLERLQAEGIRLATPMHTVLINNRNSLPG